MPWLLFVTQSRLQMQSENGLSIRHIEFKRYLVPISSSAGSGRLSSLESCICLVWHSGCRCPQCLPTAAPPAPPSICSPAPCVAFHCCYKIKLQVIDFSHCFPQTGMCDSNRHPETFLLRDRTDAIWIQMQSECLQNAWRFGSGPCLFLCRMSHRMKAQEDLYNADSSHTFLDEEEIFLKTNIQTPCLFQKVKYKPAEPLAMQWS